MDSWWYAPWVRWVVGSSFFLAVLGLYLNSAYKDGEYDIFYFLGIGVVILIPLERLMTRHPMPIMRPELLTDFLHVFLTSFLSFVPLIFIFPLLQPLRFGPLIEAIQAQPHWLQIAEALFLTEFLIYWGHRMSHWECRSARQTCFLSVT